jgi:hypothetical protein
MNCFFFDEIIDHGDCLHDNFIYKISVSDENLTSKIQLFSFQEIYLFRRVYELKFIDAVF